MLWETCAMACPLHIEFPGALYHITSHDDEDRETFLGLEIGVRL